MVLTTMQSDGRVAIPEDLRRAACLREGDQLPSYPEGTVIAGLAGRSGVRVAALTITPRYGGRPTVQCLRLSQLDPMAGLGDAARQSHLLERSACAAWM